MANPDRKRDVTTRFIVTCARNFSDKYSLAAKVLENSPEALAPTRDSIDRAMPAIDAIRRTNREEMSLFVRIRAVRDFDYRIHLRNPQCRADQGTGAVTTRADSFRLDEYR